MIMPRRTLSIVTIIVTLVTVTIVAAGYPITLSDDNDDDIELSSENDQNYEQYSRIRRTSSDQRIAELEALATLVGGRGYVGHGRIDPFLYGKRKRDSDDITRPGMIRYHPIEADEETESVLEPAEYPAAGKHGKLLRLIGILHRGSDDMSSSMPARGLQ